jgi:TonB family protein
MTIPRMLTGLMALLMAATGAAVTSAPASAQDPPLSIAAPASTPPLTRLGKMDPHHPLHISEEYYPKESRKHHEQGRCELAFYINADGSVSAAQLLKSSGYPHLDTACIESVIDVPMLPVMVNGTPVAGWSDFQVAWVVDRAHRYPRMFPIHDHQRIVALQRPSPSMGIISFKVGNVRLVQLANQHSPVSVLIAYGLLCITGNSMYEAFSPA